MSHNNDPLASNVAWEWLRGQWGQRAVTGHAGHNAQLTRPWLGDTFFIGVSIYISRFNEAIFLKFTDPAVILISYLT